MAAEIKGNNYFFINSITIANEPDCIADVDSIFSASLYSEAIIVRSPEEIPGYAPYLHVDVVQQIAANLGLSFLLQKETGSNVCFINSEEVRPEFRTSFAAIDLLDYIYAVLHSSTYRDRYRNFLQIDCPRIPYPKDTTTFWQLVALGGKLRSIHLSEPSVVNRYSTQFPIDGRNNLTRVKYEEDRVYINDMQYFANVPAVAWQFYIGSYQPAQKWFKNRKDRELSSDDMLHYQHIIVVLAETDRLMREIDKIAIE